jgi:glycerol-3-phosphate dehydrogenase (NAD(P)+)
VKTPREEAIGRLGGPHCAHCGALGAPQVRVSGEETPFDDISVRDCCSATCAVALLDEMWKGLARIINRKRGLHEMLRLVRAKGGDLQTLMGLSGIGDLMLTCHSTMSRNFRFGLGLGEGKVIKVLDKEIHGVVEGVVTSLSVHQLAERLGIEAPIASSVKSIIYDQAAIDPIIQSLMQRPFKPEFLV